MQFARGGVPIMHGRETMAARGSRRTHARRPACPPGRSPYPQSRRPVWHLPGCWRADPTRLCADSRRDSDSRPRRPDSGSQGRQRAIRSQAARRRRRPPRVCPAANSTARMAPGISLDKKPIFALLEIGLGALEDIVVHQLARARRVTQSHQIRPKGFVNAGAVDADEGRLTRRQRLASQRDLSQKRERPLGAGKRVGKS